MTTRISRRSKSLATRAGLVFLLLALVHVSLPGTGTVQPVAANLLTGLGMWSSVYQSRAVLDPSLTTNSFVALKVNVTSGLTLTGFDITVMWDPAVLAGVNVTERGGIFESGFLRLARVVAPDHVRLAGVILGRSVPGNGTVYTFAVQVLALGSSTVQFNQTASRLTRPSEVPYTAMDGFFSNQPGDGDLSLTSMTVSQEVVTLGDELQVTLGIRNTGPVPMAGVTVTLYANNTVVNSTSVGLVSPNTLLTRTLVWNTTGYSLGLYNLNTTLTTISSDSFLRDNSLALEQVTIVVHDLAVSSLSAPSSALVNSTVNINVQLQNLGTVEEFANVSIMANSTLVRLAGSNRTSQAYILSPGTTQTVTLAWNTTRVALGRYTLKAAVQAVSGESNLANNVYTDGTIAIKESFDHDLAITGSLPQTAITGQNLTLTFVVKNNGIFNEDYTLRVFLGNQILFTDNGNIAAFADRTVSFLWNTRSYTPGIHPLGGNVTSTSTDENPSNNKVIVESFRLAANQPPVAVFDINPGVPQPALPATFSATTSFDPEGYILKSYSWSFGDNSADETGVTVTHAYNSPGTYTVRLTVTDNFGASSTITKQLRVNSPPAANFTVGQTAPETGAEITFDAGSSQDSDGTIASYNWNFGDGTTGSGRTVKHAYTSPGTYQVVLTVADNDGSTKEFRLSVEVKPASFPQLAIYAIVAVGVAATAIAAWLLRARMRKVHPLPSSQPKGSSVFEGVAGEPRARISHW